VDKAGQLLQMVAAHVSPARLPGQGGEELLDGDKPLRVQHQAEFIRPVAEQIGEHFAQIFELPGKTSHGN
jgi:hypothetical protein